MNVNNLPRELLLKIFSFITCSDRILESGKICCVCKYWNQLLTLNSLLWTHLNLSYKQINFDKFQIRHNVLSDLVVLNLRCAHNLQHEYLVRIFDSVRIDRLKVLDISNCKQVKSSIFVTIADKFKKLESLTIQSIIKHEVCLLSINSNVILTIKF